MLQAFTDHYYNTFDTARANLASLYQEQSMLTFEGQKFQGMQAVSCWCGWGAQGIAMRCAGGHASTPACGFVCAAALASSPSRHVQLLLAPVDA